MNYLYSNGQLKGEGRMHNVKPLLRPHYLP